jgi:hypothetical protein
MKNNKKAFVRYANNEIVAGSLILANKAPKVGVWREVTKNLCCPPPASLFTPITLIADSDCSGEGDSATFYLYTSLVYGIPVTILLKSEDSEDLADAQTYYYQLDDESAVIITVGAGGIITEFNPCI